MTVALINLPPRVTVPLLISCLALGHAVTQQGFADEAGRQSTTTLFTNSHSEAERRGRGNPPELALNRKE